MEGNPIIEKSFTTKTPYLRIAILKYILHYGHISKTRAAELTQSKYNEVHEAMEKLVEEEYIYKTEDQGDSSKIIKKGSKTMMKGHRPQDYYELTKEGLRHLLFSSNLDLTCEEFWKLMILLSLTKTFQQKDFDEIFPRYEEMILGCHLTKNYIPYWINFPSFFKKWYNNTYTKNYHSSMNIPIIQIILEILAIVGPSSIEMMKVFLNNKIDDQSLRDIVKKYSMIITYSNNESKDNSTLDKDRFKVIVPPLIIQRKIDEKIVYELSLHGVFVVLAILRSYFLNTFIISNQDNTNKSSFFEVNDENIKQVKCDLFCRFDGDRYYYDYFHKVIDNYKNKLPLIFGKIDLLKEELGLLFYHSFDFLFFKNSINNSFDNSSLLSANRGNKEIYELFLDMSIITLNTLTNYVATGINILEKFQEYNDIKNENIHPILSRLAYLKNKVTSTEIIQQDSIELKDKFQMNLLSDDTLVERMEESLRNQITLLYYINLNVKDYINYYPKEFFNLLRVNETNTHSSKVHLLSILLKDKEIQNWLSRMLQDAFNFSDNRSFAIFQSIYNDIMYPKKVIKRILKEEKILIEGEGKKEYNIQKFIDKRNEDDKIKKKNDRKSSIK